MLLSLSPLQWTFGGGLISLAGLTLLWLSLRRFVNWIQSPRTAPPGIEGEVTTKDEQPLGFAWWTGMAGAVVCTITGIMLAAVKGPWPVPAFNAVVRPTGLLLDVVGVVAIAASVERVAVGGKENNGEAQAVIFNLKNWELPGLHLVVTGFLFQIAAALEAFQVSGQRIAVLVTPEPILAWLGGLGTVFVAFATAAAAWATYRAYQWERKRDEERESAAAARIGGIAFAVRRQLQKPLQVPWPEAPEERKRQASELVAGWDRAERRIERMLDEASRASYETEKTVRSAAKHFWDAANLINEVNAVQLSLEGNDEDGAPIFGLPQSIIEGHDRARSLLNRAVVELRKLDRPIRDAGD